MDGSDIYGGQTVNKVVGLISNPSSVLTRPNDTTPYAANDAISSHTTAGSVTVPSATVTRNPAGSAMIRRFRFYTNVTTGWGSVVIRLRFWKAAPTYSAGDNAAYAVATGAAHYLGQSDVTLTQLADGAVGIGVPSVGGELAIALASGQAIYWDMQIITGTPTPAALQTFTLIPEVYQN